MGAPTELTRCPLCASTRFDLGARIGHRQLARCRACGHRFASVYDEDELQAFGAAVCAGDTGPRATAEERARVWTDVLDLCLAALPHPRSLLDIGAGDGSFLAHVRARLPELALVAVEPCAPARAAIERAAPGVRFAAASAEALAVASEAHAAHDVAVMFQTLEHVRDPLRAVRGAFAALRPGGVLLVAVPNRHGHPVTRRGLRADCYANDGHLHFWAPRPLQRVLASAGFPDLRRVRRFGGGPRGGWVRDATQYLLRFAGRASELRYLARKPG
jgi:SAM-dependent methyltransferase